MAERKKKNRFWFRPLESGEFVSNPDGTQSTERTRTVQMAGGWALVPSLWMNDQTGDPVDLGGLNDTALANLAAKYEVESGKKFPRHRSVRPTDAAARRRSAAGGAASGSPLARDTIAGRR